MVNVGKIPFMDPMGTPKVFHLMHPQLVCVPTIPKKLDPSLGLRVDASHPQNRIMIRPSKINMEPTNHPFRKERDLPNLHDFVPC